MINRLKRLASTVGCAVAALALPFAAHAAAEGDIYEIHACDRFGNYTPRPEGTEALKGGDEARFVIRLVKASMMSGGGTDSRFFVKPRMASLGSEELALLTKFDLGIYVNGQLRMATLENTFHSDEGGANPTFTELVFVYKVEPGDFARPIRLADKDGKMITNTASFAGEYMLAPYTMSDWKIETAYTDPVSGLPVVREAEMMFCNAERLSNIDVVPPRSTGRVPVDPDLTLCNFYVETVDFDENWEVSKTDTDPGLWRSVHENSTKTVGYSPTLKVAGLPESSVTLYVWSDNEDAVRMKDGKKTSITIDADGTKKDFYVQTVKIVAGEQTYPIDIVGVAQGGAANLILSAFPDFNYTTGLSGNARISDYLTVPVTCIEPLPPSVSVSASAKKVDVGADYAKPAFELSVEVTGIDSFAAGACKIRVTPALRNVLGADWGKYVHISDKYDEEAGNDWSREGALDLEFAANGAKKVYVYALGADADTAALAKGIEFKVEENGSSYLQQGGSTIVYLNATKPVLAVEKKEYEATTKKAVTFDLTVADNYKNLTDAAGYEVYTRSGAADWTKLDGLWQPDADGFLCLLEGGVKKVPAVHPSVTYLLEGDYETSFYVKAPNNETSDMIAPTTVKVTVTKGAGASASVSTNEGESWLTGGKFNEGTELMVKVDVSKQPAALGKTDAIYAFLAPVGDAAGLVRGDCVTNAENSVGMRIAFDELESEPGYVALLDGTKAGKVLSFNVVFCTSESYDETKLVEGYDAKTLKLTVMNVVPTISYVSMEGAKVTESEEYMYTGSAKSPKRAIVPVGMTKKFTFPNGVNEPGEIDLSNETTPFKMTWTVTEEDGTTETGDLLGNPANLDFSHKFMIAGTATVTLTMRDKDMTAMGDEFVFYVEVAQQPAIVITAPESVSETGVGLANAPIVLSFSDKSAYEPEGGLVAKITVTHNETTETDLKKLGYLKLGGLEPWTDELGNEVPGAYKGTFNALGQLKFFVDDVDGTKLTANKGFALSAEIVTTSTDKNPAKIPWKDYYLPATTTIYALNVEPSFTCSLGEDNTVNTNSTKVGIGETVSVTYSVDDIKADLDAGITVQWWDTDNKNAALQTIMDTTDKTFTTKFKASGSKNIRVTVKDKDDTPILTKEWNFEVETAKLLYTVANGPTSIGSSKISAAFAGAKGRGEGHTWSDAAFASAELFKIAWSCGLKNSVNVWGWGYKAGAKDDGSLDSDTLYQHDIPLTTGGNNTSESGTAQESAYEYAGERDSFLFGWIYTGAGNDKGSSGSGSGSSGLTSTFMGLAPQKGKDVPAAIAALPQQNSNSQGGAQSAGSTSYPDTYMEAVFAKELLPSDNMGDINADGIPDAYLMPTVYSKLLGESSSEGGYEIYLTDLNWTEEGEPRTVEGDYLPSTDRSFYGQFIPGLKDDWADVKNAFVPRVKIRGYDETDAQAIATRGTAVSALNDAPALAGISGVEPDRVYTNPREDAKSTLNYVEWLAWSEFKAANPAATEKDWSPERPTDPTKKDTDADGLTDGYEYYFWYLAHVGWVDAQGNHRRLTGRRYNPRNPGLGDLISADEIAAAMDPLSGTASLTRDTDNDGLPDVLEFELGTNPFEFDTDGDGLADGWEIMIAGLDPLTASTSADAMVDTERNYDGDAMAIGSWKLELNELPVAANIEHARRWTFAVVKADGDTDGVQWYAMTKRPELAAGDPLAADAWWTVSADGVEYAALEEPVLVDGRLAKDTVVYTVEEYTPPAEEGEEGEESGDPEPELVRGYPVRLLAGTVASVDAGSAELKVYKIAAAIDAKDANACWIYGKGPAVTQNGEVAETAADYGCLALGRYEGVGELEICAVPKDDRDVAFLHYLCYQEFGFDPRTAWNPNDPLATRWTKNIDGEAVAGTFLKTQGGYAGHPSRTRAYTTYDEFLVYSFFLNNGCTMSGTTWVLDPNATELARVWGAFTTNPQGPNEPVFLNDTHYFGRSSAMGEQAATNGADSDLDGVADGWELYVMSGPKNSKGEYVFANPYAGFATANGSMPKSYFSPFVAGAMTTDTVNPAWVGATEVDDLNEFREFGGTDVINYYAAFSDTIVRDEADAQWLNKFFPTDPWKKDTDGDGLADNAEGKNFVYGSPADDGKLWSIPGGGLNPCSVDTDRDGLPDAWEAQFKGRNSSLYAGDDADYAKVDGNPVGNALQGLTDGMDGTVVDAMTYPATTVLNGVKQVVNRDYDRDGLENWQEYLTGTMRCWRYDDPVSPLTYLPSSYYCTTNDEGEVVFDADYAAATLKELGYLESEEEDELVGEFWYKTLLDPTSEIYNPHLITDTAAGAQYFSKVENVWDVAYYDVNLNPNYAAGAYYWFYNRIGDQKLTDVWGEKWKAILPESFSGTMVVEPAMYACCSPIDADSDRDGMDDYYEVFHGMNPLLGKIGGTASWVSESGSGAIAESGTGIDLIYDSMYAPGKYVANAYGTSDELGSFKNYWQRKAEADGKEFRGTTYDFVAFPWLSGEATADPDGDGTVNQEESIMGGIAPQTAWHHTDPTPLWMTDASYTNSLVRTSYRLPKRTTMIELTSMVNDAFGNEVPGFTYKDETYYFAEVPGFVANDDGMAVTYWLMGYTPDLWSVTGGEDEMNFIASFEQNEGFDSDHDGLSDTDELAGKFRGKTDATDADSPHRRQAMYFQGKDKPSILQTMPVVKEGHPKNQTYPDDMSFLHYTVECWVKAETLDDATVIERASWVGESNPGDQEFLRCNFQIGIKGGLWYTKFDPNDTTTKSVATVSDIQATTEWTHLAATYDGEKLVLYVNGQSHGQQPSGLQPAYGSSAAWVRGPVDKNGGFEQTYLSDEEYQLNAIVIGASVKTCADGATNGYALALNQAVKNSLTERYTRFFKGYVDEVRIWDGARSATEIASTFKTRYTAEMAAANRSAFYDEWSKGGANDLYRGRYAKDENGKAYQLPCELRYHWSFDSVFGGTDESLVATAPNGFEFQGTAETTARAVLSRPEGYEIAWWKTILDGYGSVYAGQTNWVTWIPNTVAHLPRFDGTTLDSFYWSEDFKGGQMGTYSFARTAEPVSFWTQFKIASPTFAGYSSTALRHVLVSATDEADGTSFSKLYEFTARHLNQIGDDLLPLGGAYVKQGETLWDKNGPMSSWEVNAGNADSPDGVPSWWVSYANDHYYSGEEEITWETIVTWPEENGVKMTAGEAYLRDIARGYTSNESGDYAVTDGSLGNFVQTTTENGIPDWWLELYGLKGTDPLADSDNDGLPNYVEYLLSEVFDFKVMFSPVNPRSVDPYVLDYFYKVGDLYVGEIFTDHDLVDDAWEDVYDRSFSSRLIWDALEDADQDGWSNRSENRYSKQSMPIKADKQSHYSSADGLVADYPIPTIELTLKYGEARKDAVTKAPIVVKMTTDSTLTGDFDATFLIDGVESAQAGSGTSSSKDDKKSVAAKTRTLGKWANRHAIGTLTPGYINKDSVALQFCFDPDALIYTWEIRRQSFGQEKWYEMKRGSRMEYDKDRRKYGEANVDLISRETEYRELENVELRTEENSSVARWVFATDGKEFGTLDLTTGAFDINLGAFKGEYVTDSTNEADVVSMEDQTYRIAYAVNPAVDLPRKLYLGEATTGHVREGKNKILAWADLDGDGQYTPGEPFGCAVGVDVSWRGTSAEIELTETSVISPRMNIATGESDRDVVWGTDSGNWTNIVVGTLNGGTKTRVRVIRTMYNESLVSGFPSLNIGITAEAANRVVLDKYVDLNAWPVITEADFITETSYDVDWGSLYTDILSHDGTNGGKLTDLQKLHFRVVLGEGTIDLGSDNNLYRVCFSRSFDSKTFRASNVPTIVSPGVNAAQEVVTPCPTFKWNMNGYNTYTAFRLQVNDASSAVVYDSGVQRAPQSADSSYAWTPSLLRVGDKTPSGKVFANQAQYTWRVTMYNSKFTTEAYSARGQFFLNVADTPVTGRAKVAVKYFGPKDAYTGKTIRVKAYTSPDFTGAPAAAGYVKAPADAASGVAVAGKEIVANCEIVGLTKGTYYLQAFIDSNGNGICDAWESMGYLCDRSGMTADWADPVGLKFGTKVGEGDLAVIYIEDADTDGDSLPDAWEYAKYGNLTSKGVESASLTAAGDALVSTTLKSKLLASTKAEYAAGTLAGEILTTLSSSKALAALTAGIDPSAFEPEVKEVAITGFAVDAANGEVAIEVSADAKVSNAEVTTPIYTIKSGDTIRLQVYHTATLAGAWQPVGEVQSVKVSVAADGETIRMPMTGVDVKGGFFKVVVIQ